MTKRMLIDATHPEEIRVAVVDGNKLEEFDFENTARKQLKGSIFLAKVTRVEPSLQAAFFDYGGNRHGFLPFPEIHPDYYKIPVADREALIEETRRLLDEENDLADETEENEAQEEDSDNTADDEDAGADIAAEAENAEKAEEKPKRKRRTSTSRRRKKAETAEAVTDEAVTEEAKEVDADAAGDQPQAAEPTDAEPTDAEPTGAEPTGAEPTGAEPADEAAADETPKEAQQVGDASSDDDASDDDKPPRTQPLIAAPLPSVSEEMPSGDDEPAEAAAEASSEGAPSEDGDGGGRSKRRRRSNRSRSSGGRSRNNGRGGGRGRRSRGHRDRSSRGDVETVGGDDLGDDSLRRRRRELLNRYKIQEVVKRRQVMLVQISKEERGTKGAAATTYLSLPGRYCVLMPNTPSGGGVSRKISNPKDRRRLKEILTELEVPDGMSVILRTAGLERTKLEIKRDLDYLLRLWDRIRTTTLESSAPATIYEEGNLVKRAIRDLYRKDIDEVLVAGENGYRMAKDFMKLLMPSHAKKVQPYREETVPLFHRYKVEGQVDQMHDTRVSLRSGGYLIINQTEALVAIDVNSGKATKERDIEETALQTNLEAAEEIARQMRLRDLGGIVVIDFIDMEDPANDAAVEKKVKECVRRDRARIQIGRISSLGLLELSRQRLRPSIMETAYETCPHCQGTGTIRSAGSTVLQMLRSLEEEVLKQRSSVIGVHAPTRLALYLLNTKRATLTALETANDVTVEVIVDDSMGPSEFRIEKLKGASRQAMTNAYSGADVDVHGIPTDAGGDGDMAGHDSDESDEQDDDRDKRSMRADDDEDNSGDRKRRRRGRRGGRRRGRRREEENENASAADGDGNAATAEPAEPADEPAEAKANNADGSNGDAETEDAEAAADKSVEQADAAKQETAEQPEPRPEPEPEPEPEARDDGDDGDDEKADDEPAHRQYEVVNEAPEKPRRGWWNRITGS